MNIYSFKYKEKEDRIILRTDKGLVCINGDGEHKVRSVSFKRNDCDEFEFVESWAHPITESSYNSECEDYI